MGRMWPPQSVNTWPTPACLRTRATSSPPVSSATALTPRRRAAELTQTVQLVEHAPLLDDASAADAVDRDLRHGDGAARGRDVAEGAAMRAPRGVARHHPVALGDHLVDVFAPIGKGRADAAEAFTDSVEALPLGHVGARRKVPDEIGSVDLLDRADVPCAPH